MAMILQVVFAVCCFVEISCTLAILPNKTMREVARFNKSLSDLCEPIRESNARCGQVPVIKLSTNQNPKEQCSGYKHEFGKIHCALKNITYNHCNNTRTIETLLEISGDLSDGSRNETCDAQKSFMKRFCLDVQSYIITISDECKKRNQRK